MKSHKMKSHNMPDVWRDKNGNLRKRSTENRAQLAEYVTKKLAGITGGLLLAEVADIALGSADQVWDLGAKDGPKFRGAKAKANLIQSIKTVKHTSKDGEINSLEVKTYNKLDALEKLLKISKLYDNLTGLNQDVGKLADRAKVSENIFEGDVKDAEYVDSEDVTDELQPQHPSKNAEKSTTAPPLPAVDNSPGPIAEPVESLHDLPALPTSIDIDTVS